MEPTFWLIILLIGVPVLFVLNDKYGWAGRSGKYKVQTKGRGEGGYPPQHVPGRALKRAPTLRIPT